MDKIKTIKKKTRITQTQQSRIIQRGSDRIERFKVRHRILDKNLKKPRDRSIDKSHLIAAFREMSEDLKKIESDIKLMQDHHDKLDDLLDDRQNEILKECLKLKKIVDSRKIFFSLKRLRSLSEPVGGHRSETILPNWLPGGCQN